MAGGSGCFPFLTGRMPRPKASAPLTALAAEGRSGRRVEGSGAVGFVLISLSRW